MASQWASRVLLSLPLKYCDTGSYQQPWPSYIGAGTRTKVMMLVQEDLDKLSYLLSPEPLPPSNSRSPHQLTFLHPFLFYFAQPFVPINPFLYYQLNLWEHLWSCVWGGGEGKIFLMGINLHLWPTTIRFKHFHFCYNKIMITVIVIISLQALGHCQLLLGGNIYHSCRVLPGR